MTVGKTGFKKSGNRFHLFALLFATALLSMGSSRCDDDSATVELTIFHTNDLHSHLYAHKADEFGLGGLAKLSTLLTELRTSRSLSLTLDAGDWSEGSWFYNLDTGANMLRLLKSMKYDAAVIGNHDYIAGPDRLVQTIKEAGLSRTRGAARSMEVLASNFDLSAYAHPAEFMEQIPGYAIFERGGLKIGVIGLTTNDYFYAPYLHPVVATEPVNVAQAVAQQLRPKVDVLLLLSHNSFNVNLQVARTVTGIDAVISGHSHHKAPRAVMVQNAGRQVPVVETSEWGKFLGELRLSVDRKRKVVKFVDYELHPVLPEIPEDPAIAAMVEKEDQRLNEHYGDDIWRVVAHTDAELDQSDAHHATLGDLATKGYIDATGADLAFEVLALTGPEIPRGPITVFDLHDVLPHILNVKSGKEWTVKVWNAKGSDVRLLMDLVFGGVNISGSDRAGFVSMSGIEVVWKPKQSFTDLPKVTDVRVQGQALDPSARYKVALTDGLHLALQILNSKLQLGLDLSSVEESGLEGWRAVLAYAEKERNFTADGLRQGGKSYTTVADPAVFAYAIQWTGTGLKVQVANDGLTKLEAGKLRCAHGIPNDVVAFKTDLQVFTQFGDATVPSLEGGESAWIDLAWKPSTTGVFPIRCQVSAAVDGYGGNSTAQTTVKIGRGGRVE